MPEICLEILQVEHPNRHLLFAWIQAVAPRRHRPGLARHASGRCLVKPCVLRMLDLKPGDKYKDFCFRILGNLNF